MIVLQREDCIVNIMKIIGLTEDVIELSGIYLGRPFYRL